MGAPSNAKKNYVLLTSTVIFLIAFNFIYIKYEISKWHQLSNGEGIFLAQLTNNKVSRNDLQGARFDDERLLYYTLAILIPPNDRSVPYVLKDMDKFDYSWDAIIPNVLRLLNNKTNGFFLECGAMDGEGMSNTLTLEKSFNWTGLLVEASPREVQLLVSKKRKAWVAPVCISLKNTPQRVTFKDDWIMGRVAGPKEGKNVSAKEYLDMLCLPFNTLMTTLGRTKVDFFSLDVAGNEYEVLKTIDFSKYEFELIVVGHREEGANHHLIVPLMESKGYKLNLTTPMDYYFLSSKKARIIDSML